VTEKRQTAGGRLSTRAAGFRPSMHLCSKVPGRERWYVDALENNPRLAAAVELVLQSEEGMKHARANPLTGRVLAHYRPDSLAESVESLIHRALEFGPMSREEFSSISKRPGASLLHAVLAAEVGCSALKLILLGGCYPLALAAAGLLLLSHRRG
jgi:hypothetical protein